MHFIIGLGNPGKKYEGTRHNVGFEVLDMLARIHHLEWREDAKHHARIAKGEIEGKAVFLAKPTTFMNDSGATVHSLLSYYKQDPQNLLIIHDEMDLPPGRLAFLAKGGAAGHNGISDIQQRLGANTIPRLRLGVGRPTPPIAKEDWVLGRPSAEDRALIEKTTADAADATKDWLTQGLSKAMNIWNTRTES